MKLQFQKLELPKDRDRLVGFLTTETWPFHVNLRLDAEAVKQMLADGAFDGSNHETFYVVTETNEDVGMVRLFDLDDVDDGYPMFDLRVRQLARGQGIGRAAVQWLSTYLFEKYSNLDRIMGATRIDNIAMRKAFRACYFAKEGHFRKDWRNSREEMFDSLKYGLLREDWLNKCITRVAWDDES